jgi:hypothetical protein
MSLETALQLVAAGAALVGGAVLLLYFFGRF